MAHRDGFLARRGNKAKLAILILVVLVVSIFVYFQYGNSYGNGGLFIDWRMQLYISDYRPPGANYTLPAGIGTPGGIWSSNHTLDSLGASGYAPVNTRSGNGTVWIQSNQIAIFTFGDLFNIWGQSFNRTCVSDTNNALVGSYCTTPAEPVVYDVNNNSIFDPTTDWNIPVPSELPVHAPSTGAALSSDQRIKYYDYNNNGIYDNASDTVIYDTDNNNRFDPGVDIVLYGSVVPPAGAPLLRDTRLRFFDANGDGRWNRSVPPPILYDHELDQVRCLNRAIALSNGKIWTVYLWYPNTAVEIQGGCL